MILIICFLLFVCTNAFNDKIIGCEICIIDGDCEDDAIHFNLSVSENCHTPFDIYYNYDTDIHSLKRYANQSIDCSDCYYDLSVDIERDAWDYTLTIVSPRLSDLCSIYTVNCGGQGSLWILYLTGSLSGLFIIIGLGMCTVRYYRANQQRKFSQANSRTPLITNA